MKRPPGVTVFAVLILLYGLLVTVLSLLGLVLSVMHNSGNELFGLRIVAERLSVIDLLQVAAQLALGIFALVSGFGMLRLRPWSWLMGMLLLGCELAIQLGNYFQSHPAYLAMFITALLIFYLNRRPTREAFGIEPKSSMLSSGIDIEAADSADAVEQLDAPKR